MMCKVLKCREENCGDVINKWLIEESREMKDEVIVRTATAVRGEDGELIVIVFYTYRKEWLALMNPSKSGASV